MTGVPCDFYIPHCSHTALFVSSYVRCQKSQGHKILRCFPHCCPAHIHYRNCGSSICLAVHGSASRAFVGFTLAADKGFVVGDVVSMDELGRLIRGRENPLATYLEGTKIPGDHFRFDEKQVDGWHYAWKSGRSKVQRDLEHVLRVQFIASSTRHRWIQGFVVVPSNDDNCVTVVGTAVSTPFTIVSYRGEHNKKKKKALAVPRRLRHPSSHEDNRNVYGRVVEFLTSCRLDDCPRDLMAWFEGLVLQERGARILPLLQPSHDRAPGLIPAFAKVGLQLAVALARPDFAVRVDAQLRHEAGAVLHKTALTQAFERVMGQLFLPVIDGVLADHGVTAVDVASALGPPAAPAIVDGFFPRFVAQIREAYIATETPPYTLDLTPCTLPLDGSWVLDAAATRTTQWTLAVLAPHYLRWLNVVTSFTQRYAHGVLRIRSAPSTFTTVPAELVCDGNPHSLRLLPNGESCMGAIAIDYAGGLSPSGDLRFQLYFYERARAVCLIASVTMTTLDSQTLTHSVSLRTATVNAGRDFLDLDAASRVHQVQQWQAVAAGAFVMTYRRVERP
ncbi:hypothetical protein ACHHYP_09983 [Achlya hypogyna]|uniref:Uncharacterized protein n=1 Tax=Achlya hypogyna TaxID=1202772 RepID=A0A1V9YM13_ACHHY|nr:hypothetical protein ACHHYP_09983 [Achlya hypogyna]